MAATVAGILLTGTHAARPAAGSVSAGTLYSCSEHSLVYQTDGSSWTTWATLGAGATTILRPPLKTATLDATYGDDFDAATLDGKWAAHSTTGSFTTSHVQTQEMDGSWVSLMFSAQNGRIYEPTTDVDQEVICCMQAENNLQTTGKVGIAILDASMNGVAMICYNDSSAYLMEITAGVLGANNQVHSTGGVNLIRNSPVWLRLTRVTNTFTGYISFSGRAWENTSTPTRNKTITASRIAIGAFNDGGNVLTGRLLFEFVDRIV